ncbi:transglutaminase family protein [Pseudomonas anguilliseptica]|uniref:Transglutaminase-like enzyme, putative cysteine protease n=1 Tax=Pseudomonas anguilliseptica TaxID=53406 RepID=A0A1H5EUJ7_PSEAG|nr:transglutaminase family protein [Pseudomonas anguilliseptica]SED94729.1 Transglutaminase-like enzyme, putative cysteine protease [Pseudomonas anguilliseptica]
MRLSISHDTTYHYEDQVRTSIQYLRMTPHDSERQQVLSWQLTLPRPVRAQLDPYGNILHVLTMDEPHESIVIGARGQVEIDEAREAEHESQSALPFLRFTRLTEADEALREFAKLQSRSRPDRSGLIDLMHAFLACARSLGIPARYVSGYLFTDSEDHLASHAWAEAWLDDAWYSFDVTNCLAKPERHLKLAVGLDYLDACPVRGMRRGGGIEQMHAQVEVVPLVRVQQQ